MYSDIEFLDIVKKLQDMVKSKDTWKDAYRSSTGQMLIELFAYVGRMLMYSIERRSQELYFETARLRSSVIHLSKLLGYKVRRASSAVGKVKLFRDTPHTRPIIIPEGFRVKSPYGYQYVSLDSVFIPEGAKEVEISFKEGIWKAFEVMSTGHPNQKFVVLDDAVESSSYRLSVGSDFWVEVDNFAYSKSDDNHYVIDHNVDDTISLCFGDGVYGKIPSGTIVFNYLKTSGKDGNIGEVGIEFSLLDVVHDIDMSVVDGFKAVSTDYFSGGKPLELTEEIRINAPAVFSTGDRGVTKEDLRAIVNSFPGVYDSYAWGEAEENPPNITMFNRVKIALVTDGYGIPSTQMKEELCEYLKLKSLLTVRYEFVDPNVIDVWVVDRVNIKRGVDPNSVILKVREVIESFFQLGKVRFGSVVRVSDICSEVDRVSGVDSHSLRLFLMEKIPDVGGKSSFSLYLSMLKVVPLSVGVYLNDVLVAKDEGTGVLYPEESSPFVTGSVSYSSGYVALSFSSNLSNDDSLRIRYCQESSGGVFDLVPSKNSILRLGRVDVLV